MTTATRKPRQTDRLIVELMTDFRCSTETGLRALLAPARQWAETHDGRFYPTESECGKFCGYLVEVGATDLVADAPADKYQGRISVAYWADAKSFKRPENRLLVKCAVVLLLMTHPILGRYVRAA